MQKMACIAYSWTFWILSQRTAPRLSEERDLVPGSAPTSMSAAKNSAEAVDGGIEASIAQFALYVRSERILLQNLPHPTFTSIREARACHSTPLACYAEIAAFFCFGRFRGPNPALSPPSTTNRVQVAFVDSFCEEGWEMISEYAWNHLASMARFYDRLFCSQSA